LIEVEIVNSWEEIEGNRRGQAAKIIIVCNCGERISGENNELRIKGTESTVIQSNSSRSGKN